MKEIPIRVLLVEDNPGDARLFRAFLHEDGLAQVELDHVDRLKTGLEHLTQGKPDVILLDLGLPDSQGLETFTQVYAQAPEVPIVVLTGLNDAEQAVEAVRAGAQDYLVKGEVSGGLLVRAIRYAIERKQVEEALRASEERWHTLVSATPDYIALHDLEGRFLFLNHYAEGFTDKEVIGSSLYQYLAPDSVEIFREHMEAAVATGTPQRFEHTAQGDLPSLRTYEDYLAPIVNRKKEISILVVSRDITERKQAERALQGYSARLAAEVAQRTRELRDAQEQLIRQEKLAVMGQLASSVAHELRNPLGVISNAVYLLEAVQPNADAAVLDYLKMIAAEVNNADKIVTDLLDFARLKGVARETVSLAALVELVLQKHPPAANVTVAFEGFDTLPPLFVDPLQIEQVLTNLVVNACQAMPEGGTLTLRAELASPPPTAGPDPEPPWVRVQVADTGTGISSENMAKLFEPLFTTKAKGIGLGLAVSKKLTEANGGKIEVQSAPGRGTTFSISLPAADRTNE